MTQNKKQISGKLDNLLKSSFFDKMASFVLPFFGPLGSMGPGTPGACARGLHITDWKYISSSAAVHAKASGGKEDNGAQSKLLSSSLNARKSTHSQPKSICWNITPDSASMMYTRAASDPAAKSCKDGKYARLDIVIQEAVNTYSAEVKQGVFPSENESFHISDDEFTKISN